MSNAFDASLLHSEPVGDDVRAAHRRDVESWMTMQSAIGNAKLHAENDLQRLTALCNRIAWGGGTAYDQRAPEPAEAAALFERLSAEDREKLKREAKAAAEQRALMKEIVQGEAMLQLRLQAEQIERARLENERRDFAQFEIEDKAGMQARFEAWRAARRG